MRNVLANTWKQLRRGGHPLVAIGNEFLMDTSRRSISTTCPPELFRLCLSHTPDNIAWARRQHIDLMLSGHVHGGQVRVPVFGSILVPSKYGRRYDCGALRRRADVLLRRPRAGVANIRSGICVNRR